MINKGTFYLHYADIYDLFQKALQQHMQEIAGRIDFTGLIFTDPGSFALRLVTMSREKPLFIKDVYLQEGNRPYCQNAQLFLCDALAEKAVADAPRSLTDLDAAKLRYIFSGAGSLLRYDPSVSPDEIAGIISSVIRTLFP